jgi:hypothetical protein
MPGPLPGTVASVVLSGVLVPVVAWCASCVVSRARHRGCHDPVPAGLEVWHGAMGVVMLLLLWWSASPAWAWAGVLLFAAAVGWSLVQATEKPAGGSYLRLALMSAAMAVMLVPASAAATGPPRQMPGMAMPAPGGPGLTAAWVTTLVVAVVTVAVASGALLVVRRPGAVRTRLSACCEALEAAAMAAMAVTATAVV